MKPEDATKIGKATTRAPKVVVAVHGIGDQYRNATIQTVVSAFCKFADYPGSVPLGHFPPMPAAGGVAAFRLEGPAGPLSDIGFVEVYWADIPRKLQTDGYVIEEAKAWARTVVERFRARYRNYAGTLQGVAPGGNTLRLQLQPDDYQVGATAIEEMIETFGVLDNLLFIAEKAGLLKFNLAQLLTNYLGDVQIVADFEQHRREILLKFQDVMNGIELSEDGPEIYIIAHSEGTVVALMGLLTAMCHPPAQPLEPRSEDDPRPVLEANPQDPPAWVKHVRGFMTLGSPIDKHLVLWPEIWDPVQTPHPRLAVPRDSEIIQWRNYYDFGDPVGFRLDTACQWLEAHGWLPFFEFDPKKHDYGFGRYLLPGAAHNDYWRDEAVFGHFIQNVVKPAIPAEPNPYQNPPRDKYLARLASNVMPYLFVLGLLYLGVYLVYKGMHAYSAPQTVPEGWEGDLVKDVTGSTALLAGMIALARIPRLTRSPRWIGIAIILFILGAAFYGRLVCPEVHHWHSLRLFDTNDFVRHQVGAEFLTLLKAWGLTAHRAAAGFTIILAASVATLAAWGSRQDLRKWERGHMCALRHFFEGARPLIIPGGFCLLLIIGYRIFFPGKSDTSNQAIWPLILASAAFIYLWWLATLLFDLIFTWHRYIRWSVVHNYLFALRTHRKSTEQQNRETRTS